MLPRCRSPWQWRTTGAPALLEQIPLLYQLVTAKPCEPGGPLGPEDRLGERREILGVTLDHFAHPGVTAVYGAHRRLRVKRGDRRCQVIHDRGRELAALGDVIQPRLLIEPRHLEQPFDRLPDPASARRSPSARVTGTRRRYSTGAVRRFSASSASSALLRRSSVVKSRKL